MLRLGILFLVLLFSLPAQAGRDVVNTRHNLSISGPGTVRSLRINQVCVFCHTPHNVSPLAPRWNRRMSGQTYIEYGSSTLDAQPGQPTGRSRLCLACHDGTVALGAFINPPKGQANDMASRLVTGRGNLGTDLGDDHPISFVYDTALQARDSQLAHPSAIDLPLDDGELQCTSCHDPHERDLVPFLRKTTLNSELCITCHQKSGLGWDWATSSHATSTATPSGATPWPERKPAWRGATVAENGCLNCHTPHTAATRARLIKGAEENTCYLCHDGTVAATNIRNEFLAKPFGHPVDVTPNPDHDAETVENPLTMNLHAECADCHNPHGVESAPPMISFDPSNPSALHSTPPFANARINGVSGIDVNGAPIASVDNQYELCFKCHGVPGLSACDTERCPSATALSMVRVDGVYNIRDKVYSGTPALVSYHPIESNNPSNDSEVPSLRIDVPLNRTTSLIYCTDCHNSDTAPAAGGVGPNGPHGSTNPGLLTQRYSLNPETAYSSAAYELCFKCHDEATLLLDSSGFSHNRHLTERKNSCVNCHDPHGSHRSQHLLNFLTRANAGGTLYEILPTSLAEPTWQDDGVFKGSCFLNCHGTSHDPKSY